MVPGACSPVGDGAVSVLPELWVPEARQWLSTSSGRMASDGYSWMQAVHWVAGSGLYEPRRYRSHGPRSFGPTTVWIAQLLRELSPCRPGIEYLTRRTGLSERAVEYHLAMLRETGLLAWKVRGTRVRGERALASEYAWMIPLEFDQALGIRTSGEGTARRVTGIAESGRELVAKLARKAARKVRRPRSRKPATASRRRAAGASVTAVSGGSRCTPMGGSPAGVSGAGDTSLPPESKLARGASKSPTQKKPNGKAGGRRRLNKVGRRYQLARELIEELDWLRGCAVPRIAWVARHVADAGWTVTDIRGWLHFRGEATRVRRGSGLLAVLLRDAEKILDTPAKRAAVVEDWRGAQEAARRHRIRQVRARTERYEGDWRAPSSRAVQREVEAAFAQVRDAALGGRHQGQDVPAEPSTPTEAEIAQLLQEAEQRLAAGDTSLIAMAVEAMGREAAERIYGGRLVRRALQLEVCSRSSLMTVGHP
ncbi:transcriptional regulator [Streptomyces sp. WAC05858]|nr:transcriptional regulator [Streptomyces sp. WAC05858]